MNSTVTHDSPSANATELIERYLQAVRFWVPKTHRQEDLLTELGEDLRSQIEDKEMELGHPLEGDDIKAILKNCGSPMTVAARLGPNRSLIGPTLYPIYSFVLKVVLLWIMVPLFVCVLTPINIAKANGSWSTAVAESVGGLWSGMFISAGIITLIFAMLERTGAIEGIQSKWDPSTLPPLTKPEKGPSSLQTAWELAFSFLALIWLLLAPQYPFLILGPAAAILHADATLRAFYVPLVVLAILALVRNVVTLAKPQWPHFWFSSLIANEALAFVVLSFAVTAVGMPRGSDWHPFVVLAEGVRNSAQYAKVPTIVNLSLLAALLSSWFGIGIAIVVHAWGLIQLKRDAKSQAGASLQAH